MIRFGLLFAAGLFLAGFMVNANSIGRATLTGKYGRKE